MKKGAAGVGKVSPTSVELQWGCRWVSCEVIGTSRVTVDGCVEGEAVRYDKLRRYSAALSCLRGGSDPLPHSLKGLPDVR
jgi:hypothetical protein